MTSRQKKTLLLLGDIFTLIGALALSLYLRYGGSGFVFQFGVHWPRFIFIGLTFIVSLYINQLYDLNLRIETASFFKKISNTIISAGIVSIIYFYLSISSEISPKTNLALFIGFFLILFYTWRYIFQTFNELKDKTGLAIIGDNEKTKNLKEELLKNPGANYQLEMVIASRDDFSELARKITSNKIKTIVLCDDFDAKVTGPFLLSLLPQQISVFNYPDFYEQLAHKIPVEALSTEWFLDNLKEGNRHLFQFTKRVVDVSLASFILLATFPLWPVIALSIKLGSDGPF